MGEYEVYVHRSNFEHPRAGEGDIIELSDGKLFLVYTEFVGWSDFDGCKLVSVISKDGGRSWQDKRVVQEPFDKNVMSVSLLRLPSGKLMMFFCAKFDMGNRKPSCLVYQKYSLDEGKTWSEPVCITPAKGLYIGMNNSRATILRSGKVLLPVEIAMKLGKPWPCSAACLVSEDECNTWYWSPTTTSSVYQTGFQEPGVIELDRGGSQVILMYGRASGEILIRHAFDEDMDWQMWAGEGGEFVLGPKATCSPAVIRRIPKTGDLLLVYNDVTRRMADPDWRSPLSAAISTDETYTWKFVGDIEEDISTTYCYPSLTFTSDNKVVLSYYVGEYEGKTHHCLASLKVKVLDIDWFYKQ